MRTAGNKTAVQRLLLGGFAVCQVSSTSSATAKHMGSTHDLQKFQRERAILQFAASQTAAQTAAHHGQSYPSTMTLFWAASALLTGLPVQGMSHTLLWLQILFSILVFGVLLVAAHLRNIELHSAQDFEQFGCHMAGIP